MPIETRITSQLVSEYVAKGYWSDVTIGERLDRMVQKHPDKTAIVDAQGRATYGEFSSLVDRLALGLHDLGIKRGDRVTAQLPNRVEALAMYFAVGKIGAVLCPVVPYYRAAEVRYILEHSEAAAIVLPDSFGGFDYPRMLEEIRPNLPALKHVIVTGESVPPGAVSFGALTDGWKVATQPSAELTEASRKRLSALKPDANEPLVLMFTSGTEAAPKAPIWTHNIIHSSLMYNSGFGFTENDILLSLAPVYHAFGLAVSCSVILAEIGATCVWMDAFDPEAAMRLIERERITAALGVPPQLMGIMNHPGLKQYDLSSLRVFMTGAAPMPSEGIRRLKAEVGCGFITLWGASESVAGPITRVDDPAELAATTVGRAGATGVEIAVIDEERKNLLPPGQPGEMVVRGPFVHAGYFKDPELTQRAFHPDGWFFTGDSVTIDEQGYVRFVSRIKDIINRGGEKISPREVEELLYTNPKVLSVAMVGMPDPRLGERNCLYLVLKEGQTMTLEEVVSFLLGKGLAKVKLPERLELVDSLPLTASGKVRKIALREDVARKLEQGL